jgi:hypothetical protein
MSQWERRNQQRVVDVVSGSSSNGPELGRWDDGQFLLSVVPASLQNAMSTDRAAEGERIHRVK